MLSTGIYFFGSGIPQQDMFDYQKVCAIRVSIYNTCIACTYSIHLYICVFIYLFAYLSICLFICLYIYVYIYIYYTLIAAETVRGTPDSSWTQQFPQQENHPRRLFTLPNHPLERPYHVKDPFHWAKSMYHQDHNHISVRYPHTYRLTL